MDDAIYRILGLAQKAGKILSGNEQVSGGIKKRQGVLLVLTEDCSERTRDEYTRACERAHISIKIFGTTERLGQALGKGVRTCALITDKGFGRAIADKIDSRK